MTKPKTVNSLIVAKHILKQAKLNDIEINNTKLQKLLYIAFGLYASYNDSRLLNELPRMLPYGPVFPRAYRAMRLDGFQNISTTSLSGEITELLDFVVKEFGTQPAGKLSTWSHREGSAWDKTKNEISSTWRTKIPFYLIKNEFDEIIKNAG